MDNKIDNKIINDKIITYISFAKKSGSLCVGFDSVKSSVMLKKSELVMLFDDISEKTKKEVVRICETNNRKYISLSLTSNDLLHVFHKKSVVISIENKDLVSAILKLI